MNWYVIKIWGSWLLFLKSWILLNRSLLNRDSGVPFMFWWKSSVKWSTKWLGLINSYRPPNSITFQFEELFSLHSQIAEQTNAFFWFWHLYQKVSLNDACLSKKKIFYDILHIARKKIKAYTNTCTNAKGLFRTAIDNTYLVYISYTYLSTQQLMEGASSNKWDPKPNKNFDALQKADIKIKKRIYVQWTPL